jgi:hypothetical protein
MMKYGFYPLVVTLGLTLVGCGGGGGSSNGGNTSSFTPTYNEYLPLIEGTGWRYGVQASVVTDVVMVGKTDAIEGASEQVYALSGTSNVISYFSSSAQQVSFWGFTGSFEIEDIGAGVGATIESVLFDRALPYWKSNYASINNTTLPDFSVSVKGTSLGIPFTVDLAVDDGSITFFGASKPTTAYGDLVAQNMLVGFTASGSLNVLGDSIPISVVIQDRVFLSQGLGIVKRELEIREQSTQNGVVWEQNLNSVVGLPEPKIFTSSQGTVTPDDADDTVRFDGGTAVSSTEYEALVSKPVSWLTVTESAGDVYTLAPSGSAAPAAPASAAFYFRASSGTALPLHISLR